MGVCNWVSQSIGQSFHVLDGVQKMSAAVFLMASAFIKQVANKNFQPQFSGPISLALPTWLFHVM